jgi:serine/threonine protein kinase
MTRFQTEKTVSLPSGTRLGHYEILEQIGAGGMGEVYKAHDPRLNRAVAVKVLLDHISEKPEASARFEREARTIAGCIIPTFALFMTWAVMRRPTTWSWSFLKARRSQAVSNEVAYRWIKR